MGNQDAPLDPVADHVGGNRVTSDQARDGITSPLVSLGSRLSESVPACGRSAVQPVVLAEPAY